MSGNKSAETNPESASGLAVDGEVTLRILENLDANIYVSSLEDQAILFVNRKMREEYGIGDDYSNRKCWQVLQNSVHGRCPFCPVPALVANPHKPVVWEEYSAVTGKYYKNTDSIIEWIGGRRAHLQHSVDITTEKAIQQNLTEAKREADAANRTKGDFLSRMSHEIRTPLNAIIGMARIGLGVKDLDKAHVCMRNIDTASGQLLALINDILDMSKIEAHKMELLHEPFDFENMLIELSNEISAKSEEKRQKLHIHMDTGMPRFFIGDEARISQVAMNLLSNAVKFTPDYGTVRMDVREVRRDGKYSVIEARVTDTGIGIPKEQIPQLFTAFVQADGGAARRFGGTGLGLAISKSIVKMMDGEFSVDSEPGKGSEFRFTIRVERDDSAKAPERPVRDIDYSSIRVLLLDASAETREYFTQIMNSFRIKSDTAATLDEGYNLLDRAVAQNEPYQLVFVDWNIRKRGAADVCKRLKEKYGSCIIILISVSQWSDIKDEIDGNVVTKFLAKPLFPSMVFNVISEAVGLKNRAEPHRATRYLFAGYRIILAEDVEINRDVLSMALEDTRVKIDYAENGQVALELFSNDPDAYDLILMDVNMPVMDGYEATRAIRALPLEKAKHIPILAMTANAFSKDVQKSIACGMNDHLTKPVNYDQLFSKLQKFLIDFKLPEKLAVTDCQPKNKGENILAEFPEIKEYIDVDDALARVRGNKKIYKTLLQSFVKNSSVPQLGEDIKAGDLDAAAKTAHSIKGASANLSLLAVSKSAMLLESQLKAGSYTQEALDGLNKNFEKTKELISMLIENLQ